METKRFIAALAILSITGAAWAIEFTKGTGNKFTLSEAYPPVSGNKICRVVDAKITSDLQDIVVGTCINGQKLPTEGVPVRVLKNMGDGSFTEVTETIIKGPVPKVIFPQHITVADFNNDGKQDFFFASFGWDVKPWLGEKSAMLLSNADGTLSDGSKPFTDLPVANTHSSDAADIDGDGNLDLYIGNMGEAPKVPAHFMMGDGKGGFTVDNNRVPREIYTKQGAGYLITKLVDVNGDNYPDLILGANAGWDIAKNGQNLVLFNDGKGKFQNVTKLPTSLFGQDTTNTGILPMDLNGDGKLDLVLAETNRNYSGTAIQILINDGKGKFTDETDKRMPADTKQDRGPWIKSLVAADINGDGAMDFYVRGMPKPSLSGNIKFAWLNDGKGNFTPIDTGIIDGDIPHQISFIDVNKDGKLDIVNITPRADNALQYQTYLQK